jgi:hypothetical protein
VFCSLTGETNPEQKNYNRSMKLHILKAFVVRFSGRRQRTAASSHPRAPLGRVQWDNKLAAKGRVVVDAHLLEDLLGNANVTQIDAACMLPQWQRQAQCQ